MTDDLKILTALLHEASLFSTAFQNHIDDYISDFMGDPEVRQPFLDRLYQDPKMRREIKDLKASIHLPGEGATLSLLMKGLLIAIQALPPDSDTKLGEIIDAIAVEIFYKRLDVVSEAEPTVN